MDNKEAEFFERLLSAFKIEADEHIKAISSGLLELEQSELSEGQDDDIIENIFRESHSLKGAARAVNMTSIETICSSLENVFSNWKKKKIYPSPEQFDILHSAIDTVYKILISSKDKKIKISELVKLLDSFEDDKIISHSAGEISSHVFDIHAEKKTKLSDTVRISTDILDSVFIQIQELLSVKQSAIQRTADISDASAAIDQWRKEWAKVNSLIRSGKPMLSSKKIQKENIQTNLLNKIIEFFDWNFSHISSLDDKLKRLAGLAGQDCTTLGTMIENILDEMKKTLLLPLSSLFEIFPKMVRDLSREQTKK